MRWTTDRTSVIILDRDCEHTRDDPISFAFIDVEVPDLMAAAGVTMPK